MKLYKLLYFAAFTLLTINILLSNDHKLIYFKLNINITEYTIGFILLYIIARFTEINHK